MWIDKRRVETMEIIQEIIRKRGIFLNGTLNDLGDYHLLPDYEVAIKKIKEHIQKGNTIVLYGDYDVDGTLGMSVAYLMLKETYENVFAYSNNRFTQGYGICKSGIDEIIGSYNNVGLIITIDNGIVAFEAIEYAKSLGIDIIVTDHHEPLDNLPEAIVVNPKRKDNKYPYPELCGCGVVWQLLREFSQNSYEYLDLVSIATVGDVVELLSDNRIIVKEGLKLLNNPTRTCLRVLKETLGIEKVDAHNVLSFQYVPIINSLSRLEGDMSLAFEFFTSNDVNKCQEIANKMIELNDLRKQKTRDHFEVALKIMNPQDNVIVCFDESFEEGIVGLTAGKLAETFNKPAIVFAETPNGLKASGRSVNGINLIEELRKIKSDLFLSLGGHTMACGLLIEKTNLENFRNELRKLNIKTIPKQTSYDLEISPEMINQKLVEEIDELGPFGEGFPYPRFLIKEFMVKRFFEMGKEGKHLKLQGDNLSLVCFDMTEEYKGLGFPYKVNAIGFPSINNYNNKTYVQFIVDQLNPSM